MIPVLILAAWLVLLAFMWCLCVAAARGDRLAQQARDDITARRQELATVHELYPRVLRDCSAAETVRDGRSIYPTWNGEDAS